jgi:hypothetical protein
MAKLCQLASGCVTGPVDRERRHGLHHQGDPTPRSSSPIQIFALTEVGIGPFESYGERYLPV